MHFTHALKAFVELESPNVLVGVRQDIVTQIDNLWRDDKVTTFSFEEFDLPLSLSGIYPPPSLFPSLLPPCSLDHCCLVETPLITCLGLQ